LQTLNLVVLVVSVSLIFTVHNSLHCTGV